MQILIFKPGPRKPPGDSFPKENTLLPCPMQQCVWVVFVFVVCLFFFSEPETKMVGRYVFMLFLLEKQDAWREHALLIQF